ncbi:type VI secretion system baseplate subunit TssE [Marinimicrobium alkaliphilum]|uniref:type VI secretion system baseplate subunit TssE n=1 Tax=Marinimicrobium alkaliphilum TaxID=2202654 RepID=UPI000DB99E4E|nr:type VI secretion system baseplate subunit TssE [Marinimicrobium alkaliphilum]
MIATSKKKNLRPSILDRLIDLEPDAHRDHNLDRHQHLTELRQSVRRDLENLLNARYRVIAPGDDYPQLDQSLLNYGLPDLATVNIADTEKKQRFVRDLERTLRDYEPRFKSVKVAHLDNRDATDRTLRFRIDAVLWADPAPQTVIFDSILEPVSRSVNVQEFSHG